MISSLETAYDGGKLISGWGWASGTVTAGWMVKMYGILACTGSTTGTDAVSVTSGYSTMALGTAATAATCLTNTQWIWASINSGALHIFSRSTMVVDAAEMWKDGSVNVVDATGPDGADVVFVAVGGTNGRESYGMGVWN